MSDTSQPVAVARLYVQSIEDQRGSSIVKLQAVSRGNHNATWAHYTPAGSMQMTVNNPTVVEAFRAILQDQSKPPEIEVVLSPVVHFATVEDGHAFVEPPTLPENSYAHGRCFECGYEEAAHRNG